MKAALTSILICCAALAAGVLLGRQLKPERAATASLAGNNPGASPSSTRLDELSFEEILRTEPESILEDLAKNPFLDLSPDEIVALARSLDLTKERSRRLLNAVASTELRGKLWEESIRANVDKIPLEDLVEIASQAVTKNAWVEYVPIMEAIETSGDPSQILSTKWGKGLLSEYLAFRAGRGASLKESLALIPPTGASSSFRRRVVEDWGSAGQAKFEDFEGALTLSKDQGSGTEDLATVAGSVWKNSSAQEKEMMMKSSNRFRRSRESVSWQPWEHPTSRRTISRASSPSSGVSAPSKPRNSSSSAGSTAQLPMPGRSFSKPSNLHRTKPLSPSSPRACGIQRENGDPEANQPHP